MNVLFYIPKLLSLLLLNYHCAYPLYYFFPIQSYFFGQNTSQGFLRIKIWMKSIFNLFNHTKKMFLPCTWMRKEKINFAIGKRCLNQFIPSVDVISPIRFHTISICSAISRYFSFNGEFGISVSPKSWKAQNSCCSTSISTWEDCNVGNQY